MEHADANTHPSRTDQVARWCFALTALAVGFGVTAQILGVLGPAPSYFDSPSIRTINLLAYFTDQSNLLVGITCLLLAIRLSRDSAEFWVFRFIGIPAIVLTGVVYHTMLAGLTQDEGWALIGTQTLHTVVPILAVLGWLAFGPRGHSSWRSVGWATLFPVAFLAFTLIRGALTGWYPYPFVNAARDGYASVAVSGVMIGSAFFVLAAGTLGLDRLLVRVRRDASEF